MDRPLDATEGIFNAFHRVGSFLPVQAVTFRGRLSDDQALQALVRLQARHSLLRTRIAGSAAQPVFVTAEARPELRAVAASAVGGIRGALEQAINGGLPQDAALPWYGMLVRAGDAEAPHALVLVIHHSLADGMSVARLVFEWLGEAAALSRGDLVAQPPVPETPPLDAVLPGSDFWQRARHKAGRLAGLFAARFGTEFALPIDRPAAPEERRTSLLLGEIGPGQVEALRERCRLEDASITGALSTAVVDAVRAAYRIDGPFPISTLVSTRRFGNPPLADDALGCYAANVLTEHAARGGFWERARKATGALRRGIARGDWSAGLQATRGHYHELEQRMLALARDPRWLGRLGPVAFSNRGLLRTPDLRPFELDGICSGTPNHVVGANLAVSAAAVNGRIHYSVLFPTPLTSEVKASAISRGIADAIKGWSNSAVPR